MTMPPGATGMAVMKRSAFFQSSATRMLKSRAMQKAGRVDRRTSAAASPPRICGPTERVDSPCQPDLPAASSNMAPAVMAPLPPVPTMAKATSEFREDACAFECAISPLSVARRAGINSVLTLNKYSGTNLR